MYRQQPSPLLYSIDIWPAGNSRLAQRETNHYIARCASVIAWSYLARSSPEQLVIDLFAQHQRFAVCCPYSINIWSTRYLRVQQIPIYKTQCAQYQACSCIYGRRPALSFIEHLGFVVLCFPLENFMLA